MPQILPRPKSCPPPHAKLSAPKKKSPNGKSMAKGGLSFWLRVFAVSSDEESVTVASSCVSDVDSLYHVRLRSFSDGDDCVLDSPRQPPQVQDAQVHLHPLCSLCSFSSPHRTQDFNKHQGPAFVSACKSPRKPETSQVFEEIFSSCSSQSFLPEGSAALSKASNNLDWGYFVDVAEDHDADEDRIFQVIDSSTHYSLEHDDTSVHPDNRTQGSATGAYPASLETALAGFYGLSR